MVDDCNGVSCDDGMFCLDLVDSHVCVDSRPAPDSGCILKILKYSLSILFKHFNVLLRTNVSGLKLMKLEWIYRSIRRWVNTLCSRCEPWFVTMVIVWTRRYRTLRFLKPQHHGSEKSCDIVFPCVTHYEG